jgi:DNA-binding ferritin-like protein
MNKKSILESFYSANEGVFNKATEMLQHCSQLHPGEEYSELGVLLGYLRSLGLIHQSHHWQTSGDNYYSDHLLFERVYGNIQGEIDILGEKIVGLGGLKLTNYFVQMKHMDTFLNEVSKGHSLTKESLDAEILFVAVGELVVKILLEKDLLTRGLEQTLGSILEKHEESLYLLHQRAGI